MLQSLFLTAKGLPNKYRARLFDYAQNPNPNRVQINGKIDRYTERPYEWSAIKRERQNRIARKKSASFFIENLEGCDDYRPCLDLEVNKYCVAIYVYSDGHKNGDNYYVVCVITENDGIIDVCYLFYKVDKLYFESALECLRKFLSGVGVGFEWFTESFEVSVVSILGESDNEFPVINTQITSDAADLLIYTPAETEYKTNKKTYRFILARIWYERSILFQTFLSQKVYYNYVIHSSGKYVFGLLQGLESVRLDNQNKFHTFPHIESLMRLFDED